MGNEPTKQTDVAGVSNTNVVVNEGMEKVDIAHSVLLIVIVVLIIMHLSYTAFRHYQKQMKKKYLERRITG